MKKWTLFLSLILVACSSSKEAPENAYRTDDGRPLVEDKYSLQADRQAMDQLRAGVPADKKRENDELALILGLMSEVKKPPTEIRQQFDSLLRKKRQQFDKDISKERETFTKEERKKRESFLKDQQQSRDSFNREKHTRDEKNQFYKELDEKRPEFFSVERDKRADFESDVRERRKNFDDYVRSKQNDFNQEHRAYSKKYDDWKKQEREKEKPITGPSNLNSSQSFVNDMSPEAEALERELQIIRQIKGTSLESGE
ncbi:MAG: hypothetical protein ACAH59_01555 [Pseudobdellovibrionaceae bacterium]